jgi:hypothetical protein
MRRTRSSRSARNLTLFLVTKRVGNVAKMVPAHWMRDGFPDHVRLLVTVVNQEAEAERDIPKLRSDSPKRARAAVQERHQLRARARASEREAIAACNVADNAAAHAEFSLRTIYRAFAGAASANDVLHELDTLHGRLNTAEETLRQAEAIAPRAIRRARCLACGDDPFWTDWRGTQDFVPTMYEHHLLNRWGWRADLHKFVGPDEKDCYHTHPAPALRVILRGGYVEELENGERVAWLAGDFGIVRPSTSHRVAAVLFDRPCYTLWIRSRKVAKTELHGAGWRPATLERHAREA